MVRKRVRDPEVLPEASQGHVEDDGSGSDTVEYSLALLDIKG
jgi:hypothetical protein